MLVEVKSLEFGCKRPAKITGKFCMGVRDAQHERKVLYGCKRPVVLSRKFCMGVRDPRCKLKSSVAQKKTHGHGYHLDFELGDRSRD